MAARFITADGGYSPVCTHAGLFINCDHDNRLMGSKSKFAAEVL